MASWEKRLQWHVVGLLSATSPALTLPMLRRPCFKRGSLWLAGTSSQHAIAVLCSCKPRTDTQPAARLRTCKLNADPEHAAQNMLQAGLIVAGWDKREGGSVYALPLGGTLIKVPFSIGTSWAARDQQVGYQQD